MNHKFYIAGRIAGCLIIMSVMGTLSRSARAQYTETETNNTKATANVLNLGTATSATISGTSATSADSDYFQINTSYSTRGIYVNQLQLNNTSQFIGSIRGLTQTNGVVNAGTDPLFQGSQTGGTATPYGFNQYYSFGGAGKTQSVDYKIVSSSTTSGGAYTATFTSTLISPTSIGNFANGTLNFNALANIGSSGVATNTSIVVFDSNLNVYYDNSPTSATFGYAGSNDNGSAGFSLKRNFNPGTYYFAVGVSTLATNDAAAPDDTSRSNTVLDFDNVLATNNTFYNGNNGNTRPADFQVTDNLGKTFISNGQVIPSLYGVNFYSFTITTSPEPATLPLLAAGIGPLGLITLRRLRQRSKKA